MIVKLLIQFYYQMFERENRREKIIEGKMREIRLRVRARADQNAHAAAKPSASSIEDTLLKQAETDFFNTVREVIYV